jgi:hypothetical protein
VDTILQTFGSLLAGAVGAALGWVILEFVARPIRRFYDLRGEIIQKMAQYGNVRARYKETHDGKIIENMPSLRPTEESVLEEAQQVMRDLAARMRAFAYNESLARWVLTVRYDPHKASQGLFGYSNSLDTYGGGKTSKIKMVEDALRVPTHTL